MKIWIIAALSIAGAAEAKVSFNKDVRPIMADTCFRCHGPDKGSRMANMRLDIRDEALKTSARGVTPIVPGDPEKSAIIQRVFSTNAKIMPPAYAHKELTQAQKDTLRQWVAEGAVYEGHWAYLPLHKPAVEGSGNPIDYFIARKLKDSGLALSPEADRPTLLRRVTLDLTGLPPTMEEIDAFLKDRSANAYEKVVDRLLTSPRYAEQQAMHWLDNVRYADTAGFHGDNALPAWPYRDYVLNAFLANKPFDVFTREQLAGDLIPGGGRAQKVASAYNRMNRTSAEGGLQPKEYLAKYGADRVRTLSSVWLGSTLGCAECHDHKFDPFLTRDFYSMKAFFADIKETGLVPDRGDATWGTKLALPSPEQQKALGAFDAMLKPIEEKIAAMHVELPKAAPPAWHFQIPAAAKSSNGTELKIEGSLVTAGGPNPDTDVYTLTLKPGAGEWSAAGIQILQDESLPGEKLARGADRFLITGMDLNLDGRPVAVRIASGNLQFPAEKQAPMAVLDGDRRTGWGINTYGENRPLFLSLRFAEPLTTKAASVITLVVRQESDYRHATIGKFRVAMTGKGVAGPGPWTAPKEMKDELPDAVTHDIEKDAALLKKVREDYACYAAPACQPLLIEREKLELARGLLDANIPRVVVTEATEPSTTRILARGNFLDDSGAIVEPAIPVFLGNLRTKGRATRLDLANWLVSPTNPLTPRVYVNRVWRQYFGIGLSKALDDFGSQGEWPTHPELLDWLAADFRDGWDMRKLVRTIVTSETYRQSSDTSPEREAKDPDNRLLSRQSHMRVDAENVRDLALAASGLLVEQLGGPSVRPKEPPGYLATLNFPKREYAASVGEDQYRRGLYVKWQRTFLYPSLLTFDAPTREECTVNRTTSNTPLQSLVLLNDPVFVEAQRVMAQRVMQSAKTFDGRLHTAFELVLSREPKAEESAILADLYKDSVREFKENPAGARQLIQTGEAPADRGDPIELAAWTLVSRAVLNLHEAITRN